MCEPVTVKSVFMIARVCDRVCACEHACVRAIASVCACVCVRALLTSGLTRTVHSDLYGPMVSGHLWGVGEYGDCQGEALAYEGNIKRHTHMK